MRVLVDDRPRDPLTPAQERNITLWTARDSAESSMLSAEEATAAHLRQTKWAFVIAGCLFALLTCATALLAEPADRAMAFGLAIAGSLAVAGVLFYFLQRRAGIWNDQLSLRLLGLAPAGSRIGFDATGLSVGDRGLPWASLRIDQVEFAGFAAHRAEWYRIVRLSLTSPTGPVVLDPAMMRNGRLIVDNVWRRLRAAA
jgi:hypothetical protein